MHHFLDEVSHYSLLIACVVFAVTALVIRRCVHAEEHRRISRKRYEAVQIGPEFREALRKNICFEQAGHNRYMPLPHPNELQILGYTPHFTPDEMQQFRKADKRHG